MRPTTVIRAVAFFDLAVTAPLAVPILAGAYVAWLFAGFGLLTPPAAHLPLSDAALLFCNLAGLLALLWNGARALQPQSMLTTLDIRGRLLVAAMLAFHALQGLPAVLWLFVASEVIGAVLQWLAQRSLRRQRAAAG